MKNKLNSQNRNYTEKFSTYILNFIKHPVIMGSIIVIFGNLFANFFSFLFNLYMSRNLSIENYGTLASVAALISFTTIIASAIGPTVVKFAGDAFSKNKLDVAGGIYIKIIKYLLILCIFIFFINQINVENISNFFKIYDKNVLFYTNLIIFFSILSALNLIYLQAKLDFKFQVTVQILLSFIRLVLGAVFVILGFSVGGAILAFLIATIISYIISFKPLSFLFSKKNLLPVVSTRELLSYGLPSAFTVFGLTSLISTDLILVKHYFSPTAAGIYAGLALVGKIIFYVSGPIANVMFPVVVRKHNNGEKYTPTFFLSIIIVSSASIFISIFYFLFPDFSLLFFLKKNEYLQASSLVGLYGIFISLYSCAFIVANFFLSIRKTKVYIPVIIFAFLQILLIIFYHNSFITIIIISIIITALLNLSLLIYYPYALKKK